MFYIGLENQIHLLIIVMFSTYIYLSSLTLKLELFLKNFGATFFIPLILSIMSFLSLNTSLSESYLFFAEFVHVTAILILLAFKNTKEINYLIFVASYAFPLITIMLNLNFNYMQSYTFLNFIIYIYIGVLTIIIVYSVLMKKHSLLLIYTGALSICASLVITQISSLQIATIMSLIFKVSGYTFFTYFFYKSTVYKLEKSYSDSANKISRINRNIQGEVNRRVEEIERSNKHLVELYKTDSLTGTYNKKAIMDFIDSLITRKQATDFSVIMLDIDKFKEINDSFGHIVGDKCIKSLVNIVKTDMRNDDEIGRYGGDEFIIVLTETNAVKAYLVADRIRKSVETTSDPHFTISIGVASYPSDAITVKDLIDAADKALYISKKSGRNIVTHIGQVEK